MSTGRAHIKKELHGIDARVVDDAVADG